MAGSIRQPTYKAKNNIIRQFGCYIRLFIQLYGGWMVYIKSHLLIQQLYKNRFHVIWLAAILCILTHCAVLWFPEPHYAA